MITAISSGEVVVDGRPERFIVGVSGIAPGHPMLRDPRVAELFGVAAAGRGQGRPPAPAERGQRCVSAQPSWRLQPHTPAKRQLTEFERSQRRHKIARHEAAHAVCALELGWGVHAVRLHEGGGGEALIAPPAGLRRGQEVRERAVAALIGPLMGGWEPADSRRTDGADVAMVEEALDYSTRTFWERQCLRDAFKAEAARLAADPQFRRRVSTVAAELEERGELTGDHVQQLIRGRPLPPAQAPAWHLI